MLNIGETCFYTVIWALIARKTFLTSVSSSMTSNGFQEKITLGTGYKEKVSLLHVFFYDSSNLYLNKMILSTGHKKKVISSVWALL